jgi:hypothetical protein
MMQGTLASYNKATGWLGITFPAKPGEEILTGLKSRGFRYESYSKRWRGSYSLEREDYLKELAGIIEQVDIAPNYGAKAEFAGNQADKHFEKSEEFHGRAEAIADMIPLGQPILVGHHSERRHRNDLEKIHSNFDKAREERDLAEKYQDRQERYSELANNGENPVTIHNRIQKLEADERKFSELVQEAEYVRDHPEDIEIDGLNKDLEWAQRWLTHYRERLAVERPKYQASGGIPTDKLELKIGDVVETQFGKAKITKVNTKTVQVDFEEPALKDSCFHKLDKTCILGKVSQE